MINSLQNTATAAGQPNTLQTQAHATRALDDLRTQNALQLEARTVENGKGGEGVKATLSEEAKEKGREAVGQEEKKKEAKSLTPPRPSRFQVDLAKRQERLNKTQDLVTQFFLSAAARAQGEEGENPPGSRKPSLDVTV
ncbi:MAG: hypothetical protein HQL51_13790 [Magnetococcales bacterium]|nr:hypothetical protein [Magnetococcales bacterium]